MKHLKKKTQSVLLGIRLSFNIASRNCCKSVSIYKGINGEIQFLLTILPVFLAKLAKLYCYVYHYLLVISLVKFFFISKCYYKIYWFENYYLHMKFNSQGPDKDSFTWRSTLLRWNITQQTKWLRLQHQDDLILTCELYLFSCRFSAEAPWNDASFACIQTLK